ncbi:hypothetical protein [Citrobacter portucalensis]|uniref:Uncharacterized protein n=1 Tax=Citrobacter portucalensis TaxID=1639133 RepID=A0ABD5GWA6_9ENTR|nr:hypothetical protein [Citrobacter portucalensis]MBJ8709299.1 hypothetical protein [Citrobacter freundii]MDW2633633.1 hypothetical protein [Citrobacter portucalensis]
MSSLLGGQTPPSRLADYRKIASSVRLSSYIVRIYTKPAKATFLTLQPTLLGHKENIQ